MEGRIGTDGKENEYECEKKRNEMTEKWKILTLTYRT